MTSTTLLALIIVAGEWTGITRALLGGPYYAGLLDIVLVGLAVRVAWPARERLGILRSPLPTLVAIYAGLALVQVLNPNVPSVLVGLEGFRKTAFTTLSFFIVIADRDLRPDRFFAIVAIGSLAAFAVAARQALLGVTDLELRIIETAGTSPISFHSGAILRAYSPTAGPFHLGLLGATVGAIAFARSRTGGDWRWLVVAAIAFAALGLTVTRANMAAGLAAIGIAALLAPTMWARVRAATAAVGPAAALALAALIAVGAFARLSLPIGPGSEPGATPPPSVPGGGGLVTIPDITNPLEDRSLQLRFGYWSEYLTAIAERPILGYGTSAAADGFDRLYVGTGKVNFEPHSLFLKAALELGVVGLVVLVLILILALRAAWRARRADPASGLAAIGVITALIVAGITGPMLDAYPVNLLIWATFGWANRLSVEAIGSPATATATA